MPIIKVGDERIKFPDGMSEVDIKKALEARFKGAIDQTQFSPEAQENLTDEQKRQIIDFKRKQFSAHGRPDLADIPSSAVQSAQALERIRKTNPAQAQNIEEMGGIQAALVSAGSVFNAILDAVGITETSGGDIQAMEELRSVKPVASGAGETLPFLVPGGAVGRVASVPGRIAAGSAVGGVEGGAITKARGGDAGDVAKGALLGAAVGGLSETIPSPGARTDLPTAKPARELVEQGGIRGVDLMTSDVLPPTTPVGKLAQSFGEKIPLVGTGSKRAAQQQQRQELVKNIADEFGLELDSPVADNIVKSLQARTKKELDSAMSVRGSAVESLTPFGRVPTPTTINAIDDIIARQSKLPATPERASLINQLQEQKSVLSDVDFSLAKDVRTDLIDDIRAVNRSDDVRNAAILQNVKSSLDKDMLSFARSNDKSAAADWLRSNRKLAETLEKTKNTELKNILNKGDATPESVLQIMRSEKPSQLKRLRSSITEKGRASARASIVKDALTKSGFFSGDINPNKFANELKRPKTQQAVNVFFTGQDKKQLDGLTQLLDATRRAQEAKQLGETGVQLSTGGGIGLTATAATGNVPAMLALFGTGTAGGLARAYESKRVRDALIKISTTKSGTTKGNAAISAAVAAINAEIAKGEEQ